MITHSKVSIAVDDGNPSHVQGTDWNAEHSIDVAGLTAALNVFTTTLKGLVPASGAAATYLKGDGSWSNATTLTAFLNAFTSSLAGVVPASGGGTANWLRADATWGSPPGRRLATRLLTGSGTYTPTTGTNTAIVWLQAGGGGGGGATTGANFSAGGGGGSGVALQLIVTSVTTGGAFACGAAGTAGTAGATGGTGGDSTIVINGVTYTAKGGTGGVGMINTAIASDALGGAGASGSTTGSAILREVSFPGQRGFVAGAGQFPGPGASSMFGAGGNGVGVAARGFGAGGAGGANGGVTGGVGTAGCILVEEFA